jgi:hypothetical protein
MGNVTEMIGASPNSLSIDGEMLARCIDSCFECAQTCTTCADGCLAEMPDEMRRCIALCTSCSDICTTVGKILARPSHGGHRVKIIDALLRACVESCRVCQEECGAHPGSERCRVCTETCRRCEQVCGELLGALQVTQ